jgi:hypothetical protein
MLKSINDGTFYVKNRKNLENKKEMNINESNTKKMGTIKDDNLSLNNIEGFDIRDGPVKEKNMDDFEELKDLQLEFNRDLQDYNQAVKVMIDNSRQYINASNDNKYANQYIRESNGAVSYVTERGTYKRLPNPTIADSLQGQNSCPSDWRSNYQSVTLDEGQEYSSSNAPLGKIIKMGGQELIKGSNMIQNQSCTNAGQNVYVTEPSTPTTPQYLQCSKNAGSYQSDLGVTYFNRCQQRAADVGSNVFTMGPNQGNSTGQCFIGGGGSGIVKDSICSVAPGVGRMGGKVKSRWKGLKRIRGYTAYATYQTKDANNVNLGDTFHITDNLTTKQYPSHMIKDGTEFQNVGRYDSYGNDIVSGSGLSLEQIKQKCLDTPGSGGFFKSGDSYWIKNKNMWPRGNRQYNSNMELYIRLPSVVNDISCSNEVRPTTSTNIMGKSADGMMSPNTKCALGIISDREKEAINKQYLKLNLILEKIHKKIVELSAEDIKLNKGLLSEYKLLKQRLNKYEEVYEEIKLNKNLIQQNSAMEEDANLNMLSYNKKYILWSMLAIGVTATAMKIMK